MISIIFWVLVSLIGFVLFIFNISILGFLHQSYFYKVSRKDFAEDLQKIVKGSITFGEYDSLTCVTIVQDKLLRQCQDEIISMEDFAKGAKEGYYFNEEGNRQISKMIEMLETSNEPIQPDKDEIRGAWKGAIITILVDIILIGGMVWLGSLLFNKH